MVFGVDLFGTIETSLHPILSHIRLLLGVCDLFYYASNILDESGEDYYSHDHSDGVDIRIKKEDRAKRMGITMSGF